MSLISIIIPTFNRKELIQRAVKSVLLQTFGNFELIIVDDASTDGTVKEQFDTDSRISYIPLPIQSGVAKARNLGVEKSKGHFIAFLDSDDEWLPKKLDCQIGWLKQNPAMQIVQTKEIWVRNGVRVNPPQTHEKFEGDLFETSLERCMITPSSVLLTRTLFDETGGFNESLPACEDYDLWLRICCRYPVGLIDEHLLIRYGGHSDQLSSSTPILDRFRIRSLLDIQNNGNLNTQQLKMVLQIIAKKAAIIANGYLKRGNQELYERYIRIAKTAQGN
jgi:glycosyltransferase involved in cell wall biosynthesis